MLDEQNEDLEDVHGLCVCVCVCRSGLRWRLLLHVMAEL